MNLGESKSEAISSGALLAVFVAPSHFAWLSWPHVFVYI